MWAWLKKVVVGLSGERTVNIHETASPAHNHGRMAEAEKLFRLAPTYLV